MVYHCWVFSLHFYQTIVKEVFFNILSNLESDLKDLCAVVKKIATSRYNLNYYTKCMQVMQKIFIGNTKSVIYAMTC